MASPAAVLSVLVKAEGINATNAQLAGLQGGLKKAGDAADTTAAKHKRGMGVITKAAQFGGIAIAGVGAASLKAAGDYEQSLNVFKAVSGATAGEMKKVGKAAIRLGADVKLPGTSAKDAAEAMTELAKGGLSVKDALAAARPVLQLSAAAQISNADAATITARALNGFNLKGKEAARVADLLAGASNASTAEITDIAAGMQQAAASAHQLGVPIEDLTTGLGLMANAGIAGSDAGTSLKTLLASFTPTSVKAAKAMRRLGLDVFDSSGKFVGLRKATDIYSKGLAGLTDEQKASTLKTIFGSDATRAANILLTQGTDKFDKMKAAVTKHGTAQDLAAAKTKGFKGSLEAMKSTLETLAITFGTILLPAATSVLKTFSNLFGKLGSHKTETLALVAALGTLATAVVTVTAVTKTYTALAAVWTVATGAATVATGALGFALVALQAPMVAIAILFAAHPFIVVAVAVAALVAAVVLAYKHCETFRNIINGLWGVLKTVTAWLITAGVAAFTAIKDSVVSAWNAIRAVTNTVWGFLKTFLIPLWNLLAGIAKVEFIAIRAAVQIAWFAIRTVTTTVWNGLKAFLLPLWNAIKTAGGAIFGALRTVIVGEWNLIKAAATTIWNLVKSAILIPIRAVRDALGGKDGIWGQVHDTAVAAWNKIKGALGTFAGNVKDGVLNGIKGGLNLLIGFVNKVISVVNSIPGVTNIKPIAKLAQGGTVSKAGVQGLAEGGIVNKPIVMMGEEAPKWPEYVIPTNPAYKKRAGMLLGQAANAIGFQTGGIYNVAEMADLWRSKGGSASLADTMGTIGLVESGGNPNAHNPSGASGLWQILGQLVPGNIFNPGVNALNAIAKYKAQGLGAWDASKSKWGPLIGKTSGIDLNPLSLLKRLPGLDDLPDWLKGTGKWLLDQVGDWIKRTVKTVLPGGGGTAKGPSGIGMFEGLPMANWVIGALKHARSKGFTGQPTSGYRSHAHNVAQGRTYFSEHEGTRYPHGAVDFGGFHTGLATKLAAVAATADYKYPLLAPIGFTDDGHASGTGHRMGGILGQGEPFVGSYARGGRVPADGYGYLHQGETVVPRGQGGPMVHVEHMEIRNEMDLDRWSRKFAWHLATGGA